MISLQNLTEQQIRARLNVSPDQFEYFRHPSPSHLHDPLYYKNMRELVMHLHRFKQRQEEDPSLILVVDGDYDTDGVCAAVILTAALSALEFRFFVYIPSMAEGYGMNRETIYRMKQQFETDGRRIGMILTADQGINAETAIEYAKAQGIQVLVTDHHPTSKKTSKALAAVNPNQPEDRYPFKGNSGGCVAWKTMLAYAQMFARDKEPLIQRLILFAGLSNVADVMPVLDENRYTIKAALDQLRDLLAKPSYQAIADTPYPQYNAVFYGICDMVRLLQEDKDLERAAKKKKPVPLPDNEELFSWYLSPMLNAPRRVHDTCLEALSPFLVTDHKVRQYLIRQLIALNKEKSRLRDRVLDALTPENRSPVLCINARKGIAGLVAGRICEETQLPSIVFAYEDPSQDTVIYGKPPCSGRISGSARSTMACPLNRLAAKIEERHPGLLSGGGHAQSGGFSIQAQHLPTLQRLLNELIPIVSMEVLTETAIVPVPENRILLVLEAGNRVTAVYQKNQSEEESFPVIESCAQAVSTETFASDVGQTLALLESLRPFGKDFPAQTQFQIQFGPSVYEWNWNPGFWKTFKFRFCDVDFLTFDETWSDQVKETLKAGEMVQANARINKNVFRGQVTYQMILSPLSESCK